MLTGIRKLNVVPLRLTALVLLAVVIVTLLVACTSSDDGGGGTPPDPVPPGVCDSGGDSGEDNPMLMNIMPISRTLTTPPLPGCTQKLEVFDDGTYQNLELDASGIPQFDTLVPTGRTYTAMSSAPDIATTSVNTAGIVTVTALKRGIADITITAEGDEATTSTLTRSVSTPSIRQTTANYLFTVEVANRAPTVENPIPDQTDAEVGTAFSYVFPANTFNDADDDPLSYTASEQPDVAWLSFIAATRTFSGMPAANTAGSMTVTVTADDGNGGSVTDTFTIGINRPPMAVGAVAALTFTLRDSAATRDVASNFSDPDNAPLIFTASTSAPAVATASVSGSMVTVTPEGVGSTTITVTARDPGGLSATQTIEVIVNSVIIVPPSSVLVAISGFNGETEDEFTLRATVSYSGTGTTDPTTVRYYRSSDSTIESSDTEVGDDDLISSRSAPTNVEVDDDSLSVPSSPGIYYYGACATATAIPVCSDGVEVVAEGTIDLEVTFSVDNSDSVVTVGESIGVDATVENHGTGRSERTTLRYYQSSDLTISRDDIEVEDDYRVSSLGPDETDDTSESITAPSPPGTYYYGACVDPVDNDRNTENDCSDEVMVIVKKPINPDSVSAEVMEFNEEPEDEFELHVTVHYMGTGEIVRTTVKYYRSSDSTISSSNDVSVGSRDFIFSTSISGSKNRKEYSNVDKPDTPGTYYYGACAKTVTTEKCSNGVEVGH